MPFRLNEFRAKIQFVTSAETPTLLYKACVKTGAVSNTAYLQRVVAEALSRDLDIPLDDLLANLPPVRGDQGHAFGDPTRRLPLHGPGPTNTVETVE